MVACQQHFLPALRVGDDGEAGDFRSRARGGRNRHMRWTGQWNRLGNTIVPDLTLVGGQHADGLGCVDRTTASQAHQAVVSAELEARRRLPRQLWWSDLPQSHGRFHSLARHRVSVSQVLRPVDSSSERDRSQSTAACSGGVKARRLPSKTSPLQSAEWAEFGSQLP